MSDEKTFTKAELDAAIAAANEAIEAKRNELLSEVKDLKLKLRASQEIKPEDLTAMEQRAEKAEAALAEANKAVKALTGERDKAVKQLEAESGAARKFALEAELASAIAEGNVIPALVPAFKAMIAQQAKADLTEAGYAVTIGDQPARDYIKTFLDTDEGKAFRAAPINNGGNAPGGAGNGGSSATMTREQFTGLNPAAQTDFVKGGGKVVDQAA